MNPERGQVYMADLGEPQGSRPALRRPVVVVQSDGANRSRLPTVIVAATTTNLALADLGGNVHLEAGQAGLPEDSVIVVSQLVTLNKTDLEARLGRLPRAALEALEAGLRRILALP